MDEPLLSSIRELFAEKHPHGILHDFEFVTRGWESDAYAAVLHRPGDEPLPVIFRVYPDESASPKMLREARGLSLLREAGYPVPTALLSGTLNGNPPRPVTVMERLHGQSLWQALDAASDSEPMLDRFGELITQLHRIDWRPFSESAARVESEPATLFADVLAESRALYRQFSLDGFGPLADWLESELGGLDARPAVVHLDLHANNVFVCADGVWSVIDWTQITVSDYRADLAWTLMIMGDFGRLEWGDRILEAYRRSAATPIEGLEVFSAIACAKVLASTVISLKGGAHDLGLRPETADSIAAQAPVLRKLARRIHQITGLAIPEVETALEPFH